MQFNKQGRAVSESMRLKAFLQDCPPTQTIFHVEIYRGFNISGQANRWYVADWPLVYSSCKAARLAVDRCLAIRKEIGPDGADELD